MVFCYECGTLHGDLHDLNQPGRLAVNHFNPASPIFVCPQCAYPFEYFFMRDGKYKTSLDQWHRQGLSRLLNSGRQPPDANVHPGLLVASRIKSINWFAHCGERFSFDLSMETKAVTNWSQAIEFCKDPAWENAQLEAQNQLTVWLHLHDHANYQKWNEIVISHKNAIVNPLTDNTLTPFQAKHGLDIILVHSVQWDILGALMENSYLSSGHPVFFFLELLTIYEAGHFPCGWDGEWPHGKLCVY
jgi:hypothetical protein